MTITRVTAAPARALTLAAFAFLSVAAISAISMLSPMQKAIAQELTPVCVVPIPGGETEKGDRPHIVLVGPGEFPIGRVVALEACGLH
jgi:hypothetical protein